MSSSEVTSKSEFDGSITIFTALIGIAMVIKVIVQAVQSNKPESDPSIPTVDNPTGTNSNKINGQADAIIATYGWSLFWIICLWVTIISILTRRFVSNVLESARDSVSVFFYSIPFLSVLIIILWTIIQTYTFRKKINTNQVPSTYLGFSIGSTFLLGLTVGLLFFLSKMLLQCKREDIPKMIMTAWLTIICALFTGTMTGWIEVLLTSFTTDG
jgi:hypothetical protein